MSTRRRILGELREFGRIEPGGFLEADGMKLWIATGIEDRAKIALAMNQLLDEALILGIRAPPSPGRKDQGVAIRLNPDKLDEVDRELNVDWKWIVGTILAILGAVAGFLALRHSN